MSIESKGSGIPKPSFPGPRPRRSSIGQAAAANAEPDSHTAGQPDTRPDAATSTPIVTAVHNGPAAHAENEAVPTPSVQPEPEVTQDQRPTAARTRKAQGSRQPAPATAPAKVTVVSKPMMLSLPEDAKARMVNTISWTRPHTGIGSQQKFIRKAISDLCDRLEREFNDGQPFPEVANPQE